MGLQSTVAYKKDADAIRSKVSGTGTGEMARVKEQTLLSSTVAYKKDAEKAYKGKGMAVASTVYTEHAKEAVRCWSFVRLVRVLLHRGLGNQQRALTRHKCRFCVTVPILFLT